MEICIASREKAESCMSDFESIEDDKIEPSAHEDVISGEAAVPVGAPSAASSENGAYAIEEPPSANESPSPDSPAAEAERAAGVKREGIVSLLFRIYKNEALYSSLSYVSHAVVLFSAMVLMHLFADAAMGQRFYELIFICLGTGIPFVLVSLARRRINAPRPYEVYDFYKAPPKNKCGESFPSRHVFSAFVIATVAVPLNPYLGMTLMLLGVLLAVCRVLLGYHFITDVTSGALIGMLSGELANMIYSFFI